MGDASGELVERLCALPLSGALLACLAAIARHVPPLERQVRSRLLDAVSLALVREPFDVWEERCTQQQQQQPARGTRALRGDGSKGEAGRGEAGRGEAGGAEGGGWGGRGAVCGGGEPSEPAHGACHGRAADVSPGGGRTEGGALSLVNLLPPAASPAVAPPLRAGVSSFAQRCRGVNSVSSLRAAARRWFDPPTAQRRSSRPAPARARRRRSGGAGGGGGGGERRLFTPPSVNRSGPSGSRSSRSRCAA